MNDGINRRALRQSLESRTHRRNCTKTQDPKKKRAEKPRLRLSKLIHCGTAESLEAIYRSVKKLRGREEKQIREQVANAIADAPESSAQ